MRTMEPREKGRFEKHMKVAHFLLGLGSVGGDQREWVRFQDSIAHPKKRRRMEVSKSHGSVLASGCARAAARTASASQVGSPRRQRELELARGISPLGLVRRER